jgi:hypothetical protein
MKKHNLLDKHNLHRMLFIAGTIALVAAFAIALPRPAQADKITSPAVPSNLQVLDGSKVFLVGHATGTQNYICLPSGSGFAFIRFTPQATLFDDSQQQLTTHFSSPNPNESGTVRPTWEDSRDTSKVWARMAAGGSSTDPAFVEQGAIPWLLLDVVHHQNGPAGGDRLSAAKHIQRVNTHGGAAPSTGCALLGDVGNRAYTPYTADYYFYKSGHQHIFDSVWSPENGPSFDDTPAVSTLVR